MSDPTITRRDTRDLDEIEDLLGAQSERLKRFADRMPDGSGLRQKARKAEQDIAVAQGSVTSVKKAIDPDEVRM